MLIIHQLVLGRWNVSDRLQYSSVVKPVHPFQGCVLDFINCLPRAALANNFGLVKPIDRFSQCVVVGVADTANRRFDTRLGQFLGVVDRQVLAAAVTVVD